MVLNILIILIVSELCVLLGWVLTQSRRFSLALRWKLFDHKPFNCRPCLTFHLCWMAQAAVALQMQSLNYFLIALVYAFILFGVIYLQDKSKITK